MINNCPIQLTDIDGRLVSSVYNFLDSGFLINISLQQIGLGVFDRTKSETGSVYLETQSFVMHNDYNSKVYTNDIAVVNLPRSVTFTNKIRPACLPLPDRDLDGKDVVGESVGGPISCWFLKIKQLAEYV